MAMLSKKDESAVRDRLASMVHPVTLVNFTQDRECQFCSETRQLVEELGALSDKLHVRVQDFVADKAQAGELGIDKIPAIALVGEEDSRIRFYGIPSGYEFGTLIEDILSVSLRDSGLGTRSRERLAGLETPLHIQVFITPT